MICTQVTQISHSTVGSSFSVSFSADSTPNDLEMLRMMREWFMRWNNSGVSFTKADTPQTEQRNRSTAEFITGTQIGDPQPLPNGITTWASSSDEPQTDCDTCRHKGVEGCEQPCLGCGCCGLYEAMTENDKLKEKVVEFIKSCARCKHRPIGAMMCEESCHYEPKTEPQTERSE